jgi:hypothetical protein
MFVCVHLHKEVKWVIFFAEVKVDLAANEFLQRVLLLVLLRLDLRLLCESSFLLLLHNYFPLHFILLLFTLTYQFPLLLCQVIPINLQNHHIIFINIVPFTILLPQLHHFTQPQSSITIDTLYCTLNPFRLFRNESLLV